MANPDEVFIEYLCPECGEEEEFAEYVDHYCPECGAKMIPLR